METARCRQSYIHRHRDISWYSGDHWDIHQSSGRSHRNGRMRLDWASLPIWPNIRFARNKDPWVDTSENNQVVTSPCRERSATRPQPAFLAKLRRIAFASIWWRPSLQITGSFSAGFTSRKSELCCSPMRILIGVSLRSDPVSNTNIWIFKVLIVSYQYNLIIGLCSPRRWHHRRLRKQWCGLFCLRSLVNRISSIDLFNSAVSQKGGIIGHLVLLYNTELFYGVCAICGHRFERINSHQIFGHPNTPLGKCFCKRS